MATRSWFDHTNDDVTAWWVRDLIRRGVLTDHAAGRRRRRRRPNRFKPWLLILERRRGHVARKHRNFAILVEIGLFLAVMGLLIGLTLHVIGPVLFGIGCCLLIPTAFWFVWEFSYRSADDLPPEEEQGEEEQGEESTERNSLGVDGVYSYRTTEELEQRHMPRESDDEYEDEVNERNTTDDSVNRWA
ncbi:Hypp9041 [Branchiostoma lanceolatum]|uniref:Hypp9041 protein n=1 Tax=Branchiostoma lanceolatum TaxID=7740 RepID=A0A8J9ZD33_BRALA|nr:Hypp9041 [Branchiostoma lanceolatum]